MSGVLMVAGGLLFFGTLWGAFYRLERAHERISDLEDRVWDLEEPNLARRYATEAKAPTRRG